MIAGEMALAAALPYGHCPRIALTDRGAVEFLFPHLDTVSKYGYMHLHLAAYNHIWKCRLILVGPSRNRGSNVHQGMENI